MGGEVIDRGALGREGEAQAVKFLEKQGYRIVEKNFRSRYGEIDIIALKSSVVVFIEVKRRRNAAFGFPCEAVGKKKQEHIVKSALAYIKMRALKDTDMRFDVLSIGPEPGKMELLPSAFTVPPRYTY